MNEMKQRNEDKHACHKAVCHPCVNSALYTVTLLSSADIGFSVLLLDVDFQQWNIQYTCSEGLSLRLLKLFTIHSKISHFLSCKPKLSSPLGPSLYLFPAPSLCAVIESSCDRVTIVQTEQLLEEGPGFIQRI